MDKTIEVAIRSGANIWNSLVRKSRSADRNWFPDLAGADLRGAKLNGADLTGANLTGANLNGVNLGSADLTNADLTGADLTRADLTRANLTEANLTDATLAGAHLTDAHLAGANLTDAKLSHAHLNGAILAGASLADANLARANLDHADLARADLARADLTDADLSGANLTDAHLTRAQLTRAKLEHANLTDAHLPSAKLSHADLSGADLTDADLTQADLTRANLTDADMRGSNLTDANLGGAYLFGVDLSGANLTGANLIGAIGPPAKIRGADLTGAILYGPGDPMTQGAPGPELKVRMVVSLGADEPAEVVVAVLNAIGELAELAPEVGPHLTLPGQESAEEPTATRNEEQQAGIRIRQIRYGSPFSVDLIEVLKILMPTGLVGITLRDLLKGPDKSNLLALILTLFVAGEFDKFMQDRDQDREVSRADNKAQIAEAEAREATAHLEKARAEHALLTLTTEPATPDEIGRRILTSTHEPSVIQAITAKTAELAPLTDRNVQITVTVSAPANMPTEST